MKVKGLCAFAMLLTSSLANADVANLDDQYYTGLNLGAGWGSDFVMKPSAVFGYHHNENSKFELEALSNIKSLKSIEASLLTNYCFYSDIDIDPVGLYVSTDLGGSDESKEPEPEEKESKEKELEEENPKEKELKEEEPKELEPTSAIVGTTVSPIYANEKKPIDPSLVDNIPGSIL